MELRECCEPWEQKCKELEAELEKSRELFKIANKENRANLEHVNNMNSDLRAENERLKNICERRYASIHEKLNKIKELEDKVDILSSKLALEKAFKMHAEDQMAHQKRMVDEMSAMCADNGETLRVANIIAQSVINADAKAKESE